MFKYALCNSIMLVLQYNQFPNPNCTYIPLIRPSSAHTKSLGRSN